MMVAYYLSDAYYTSEKGQLISEHIEGPCCSRQLFLAGTVLCVYNWFLHVHYGGHIPFTMKFKYFYFSNGTKKTGEWITKLSTYKYILAELVNGVNWPWLLNLKGTWSQGTIIWGKLTLILWCYFLNEWKWGWKKGSASFCDLVIIPTSKRNLFMTHYRFLGLE